MVFVGVFCVAPQRCTDPCISILCSFSDFADPAGEIFQTLRCHVQTLDRVRAQVLRVDGKHKGPGVLPVFMHGWREGEKQEEDGRAFGGFHVKKLFLERIWEPKY